MGYKVFVGQLTVFQLLKCNGYTVMYNVYRNPVLYIPFKSHGRNYI